MNTTSDNNQPLDLNDKLNSETARIHWHELQRHFARGVAIYVSPELDLVNVAQLMAADNSAVIASLMQQGKIGAVSNEQADTFYQTNQAMWAVVVAPWVLVQPDVKRPTIVN